MRDNPLVSACGRIIAILLNPTTFVLIASLSFLSHSALAATPVTYPSPETVLNKARDRWGANFIPPYLTYTVAIRVIAGPTMIEKHYDAACSCRNNELFVHAVSDEERAHPYVSSGTNVVFTVKIGMGSGAPETARTRLNKEPTLDPLGIPELSPILFSISNRRSQFVPFVFGANKTG